MAAEAFVHFGIGAAEWFQDGYRRCGTGFNFWLSQKTRCAPQTKGVVKQARYGAERKKYFKDC